MYSAKKLVAGLAIIILLAVLTGCSTISVNYDYDNNTDWAKFKTYAWMGGSRGPG